MLGGCRNCSQLMGRVRRGSAALAAVIALHTSRPGCSAAYASSSGRTHAGDTLLALLDEQRCAGHRGQPFAFPLGPLPPLGSGEREKLARGRVLDMAPRPHFPRFGRCILVEEAMRVADGQLEDALVQLVRGIPEAARAAGAEVALSRFDLFHGHLFRRSGGRGLGLLLHASEYPAKDAESFPVELGFCQQGSTLQYDGRQMQKRNILVLLPLHGPVHGYVLDATAEPVRSLIPEYLQEPVYTLDESMLGTPLADVYFLPDASVPLAWVVRSSGWCH
mmetsp:Transcript_108651/g.307131  ORF Transcript_108651/g.307131 Transcript_108651/m.307131 type:complete len:277 (-) Transcript_108651:45-875(-)